MRWIVFIIGTAIMLGCMAANLATLYGYLTKRERGSMIPLVGGASGAVAIAFGPFGAAAGYWWLPLVVDPGSLIWLVATARSFFSKSDGQA